MNSPLVKTPTHITDRRSKSNGEAELETVPRGSVATSPTSEFLIGVHRRPFKDFECRSAHGIPSYAYPVCHGEVLRLRLGHEEHNEEPPMDADERRWESGTRCVARMWAAIAIHGFSRGET